MSAFAYIVAAFCALWFVQAAVIHRNLSHIADLAKLDPPAPERWPSVSVVMAARNEGAFVATVPSRGRRSGVSAARRPSLVRWVLARQCLHPTGVHSSRDEHNTID